MNKLIIPVIASILILGGIGLSQQVFATGPSLSWIILDEPGTAVVSVSDPDQIESINIVSSKTGNTIYNQENNCPIAPVGSEFIIEYSTNHGFDITATNCEGDTTSLINQGIESNENNGNNGCEKSNPNSKACEKNPNANNVALSIFFHDSDGLPIPNTTCKIYASGSWAFIEEGSLDNTGRYETNVDTNVLFPWGLNILCSDNIPVAYSLHCDVKLNEDGTTRFVDMTDGITHCPNGV